MRKEIAEQIPEMHLCPFCDGMVSGDWDDIVNHMIEKHSDEEAKEQYAISKTKRG